MVNMSCDIPHVFPACDRRSGNNPAVCMDRKALACTTASNRYARLFVVNQRYENLAKPECALRNGTIFNDLFMPYVPEGCECRCERGRG